MKYLDEKDESITILKKSTANSKLLQRSNERSDRLIYHQLEEDGHPCNIGHQRC